MLTARGVITVTLVIVVISILGGVISMVQPPGMGGLGVDTFGTRPHGYKAIFDILADLGVQVDRGLAPFANPSDQRGTFVLWSPDSDLVGVEPVYVERAAAWVRDGGRVVVAPGGPRQTKKMKMRPFASGPNEPEEPMSTLKELGLAEVETRFVDVPKADDASSDDWDQDFLPAPITPRYSIEWPPGSFDTTPDPGRPLKVTLQGDFEALKNQVATLQVPRHLQVLDLGDSEPTGRITANVGSKGEQVLAAKYRVGQGEIIVVGDASIFDNGLIARQDNSVLAADVLIPASGPVRWDEFYHGLIVRGNPWFLLTRGQYAVLALMLLVTTGAWVWRESLFLGPPLEPAPSAPRSIAEYAVAMARLFRRGQRSRRFVLAEFRDGSLWWLRQKLGLRPGQENVEDIQGMLARRDPRAAQQVLDAVAAVDLTLSRSANVSDAQTLQALQRLANCL